MIDIMEDRQNEFKREYTDDIRYTVLSFANTDGGKIYIGVSDDGSVCGVADTDGTMLRVTNMIRDAIRPDVSLFTECSAEKKDGKNIIVLTVQRGIARPYYLTGKGIRPEGVYVRQGASSVPASETAILNMIKETAGDSYEKARSLNQQLTFETAEAYFAKKQLAFGAAQKKTLHVINEDGTFSNLGMLLSDQCVHTVRAAVFDGSKKTVFRDRKEFTGSLFSQIDDIYTYIDRFNSTRAEFEKLERTDRRDYPEEALREALMNAVVHRDYSVSGASLISIFDDRIEFLTIGGLVSGITYDDIMLGVSALRNSHLADIFYRLKLIEAYGTGLLKIRESYAESEKKPLIEVSSNAFKITLPNRNFTERAADKERKSSSVPDTGADSREETILSLAGRLGSISRKDAEAALGISQATAVLLLRKMTASGILIKENSGKNTRYRSAKE